MKRLPLDTSSFRKLREKGLVYVDKTPWIYRMIDEGETYFLSRPRRFGKSLTVNTLKELFKGNKELFKGLWIEDKWEFKPHPVLLFDFNGIGNKTPDVLDYSLRAKIGQILEEYDAEMDPFEGKDIDIIFSIAITKIHKRCKMPVVILIDEYDKPILDHLGLGEERLSIAKQNREILKSFFGVLKEGNIVDIIRFVFVTGVSRFTKVSIFSEWNNLQDISMEPEYADFLGYTEDEIIDYFSDYIDKLCQSKGISKDECMERIRYWYNGYRFSIENETQVYNPISVMYCLKRGEFKNYWFKTATPSYLVNLIKEKKSYYIPELEEVEYPQSIFDAFELEGLPIETMLYQSGYLTIKGAIGDNILLGYPNQEVKVSFHEVLLKHFYDAEYHVYSYGRQLGEALRGEKLSKVKELIDGIFSSIPYTLYQKADERYFHTIMYLTLSILGYDARSELLSSRGRLDMAVLFRDKVYVLEFKVGKGADEVLRQIKDKGYAERFKGESRKIILCGISFDSEKRQVEDIRFEAF